MKTWLAMKANVSVDHRVSDGAEAAQFMQTLPQEHTCTAPDAVRCKCRDDVAKYLEEPLRLLV